MQSTNPKQGRYAIPFPKLAPVSLQAQPRRKRDRVGKQQALMLAAAKLFAHRGYEVTTTREIAASAGCAEGLIHRYFKGKAGLFLALVQSHAATDNADRNSRPPVAEKFEDEFLRLVEWEVDRRWEDRDFLKIIVRRALVEPAIGKGLLGEVSALAGASRDDLTLVERLMRFRESQHLRAEEVEILARLIEVLGFGFGFLRPVVFGHDRLRAKKMAITIATIVVNQIR
jgi:AcrR family transcriptional regulator